MIYGSLFSGIDGFGIGFNRAGMTSAWHVEIDNGCQYVLKKHYPGVEIHDDIRFVGRQNLKPVDLICGGFPCQDLSIAGPREGLDGERSGLWFQFIRVVEELTPSWVVVENVPGLLSSNEGRDFAIVIQGLVKCGYSVAWRVLDSQFFGVPQRRRRVFIVASFRNGRSAQVLFERESSPGDFRARRKETKGVAHALSASSSPVGRLDPSSQDFVIAYNIQHNDGGSHKRKDRPNGGLYVNETDTALTVGSADMTVIWQNRQQSGEIRVQGETINAVTRNWGTGENNVPMVGIRRLTPLECERLQGFPDNWTAGQSDSARYMQLGNAVTVPVAEWLGRRIMQIERDSTIKLD